MCYNWIGDIMAKQKKTTKNVNKKKKTNQTSKEVLKNSYGNDELKNGIKCVVIVLAIFAIMYLLTLLILKKASTDYITNDNEKTSIQYSKILHFPNNNSYLVLITYIHYFSYQTYS